MRWHSRCYKLFPCRPLKRGPLKERQLQGKVQILPTKLLSKVPSPNITTLSHREDGLPWGHTDLLPTDRHRQQLLWTIQGISTWQLEPTGSETLDSASWGQRPCSYWGCHLPHHSQHLAGREGQQTSVQWLIKDCRVGCFVQFSVAAGERKNEAQSMLTGSYKSRELHVPIYRQQVKALGWKGSGLLCLVLRRRTGQVQHGWAVDKEMRDRQVASVPSPGHPTHAQPTVPLTSLPSALHASSWTSRAETSFLQSPPSLAPRPPPHMWAHCFQVQASSFPDSSAINTSCAPCVPHPPPSTLLQGTEAGVQGAGAILPARPWKAGCALHVATAATALQRDPPDKPSHQPAEGLGDGNPKRPKSWLPSLTHETIYSQTQGFSFAF